MVRLHRCWALGLPRRGPALEVKPDFWSAGEAWSWSSACGTMRLPSWGA